MLAKFTNAIVELWERRLLLRYLVKATLKISNRGMLLGYFWWILEPLFLMCIYYFLLHMVLGRGGPNFALFLLVALIPFRTMIVTLNGGISCISRRAGMVTQMAFPRVFLPIAETVSTHIMLAAGFIVVIVGAMMHGKSLGFHLIWLAVPFTAQFLIGLGLTLGLSVTGVFLPDLRKIVQWGSRAWLYASPVLYVIEVVPQEYRALMNWNPMTPVLQMYRRIIIRGEAPLQSDVMLAFGWSFGLVAIGLIIFYWLDTRALKKL